MLLCERVVTETTSEVTAECRKRAQRVRRESFTWKSVQARLKRTRIEIFRPKCTCDVKNAIFDRKNLDFLSIFFF